MRLRSILFLLVFSALLHSASAQDHRVMDSSDKPWLYFSDLNNILYRTVAREAINELDRRGEVVARIDSRAEVEARAAAMKKVAARLIGEFPERSELHARVTGTIERDGYTIEKVVFESQPGLFVTATVYKPRSATVERFPAILYLCGHARSGIRSKTYQTVMLNLVQKGFLVMAIDPIGQGERVERVEREFPFDYTEPTIQHNYVGAQCRLAGSSLIKHIIWDAIRAIDYLETRGDVDMSRIGATGRSGGGTQTAWLGLFEKRLKATAIENYMTSFRRLIQSIGLQDAEQSVDGGIRHGLDFADLLLVRAPEPTLVLTTEGDFFNIEGAKESFQEGKHYFSLLKAEDNLIFHSDIAGHSSTQANREKLYEFFMTHLGVEGDFRDLPVETLGAEALTVLPESAQTRVPPRSIFEINKEAYLTRKKDRPERKSPPSPDSLQDYHRIEWNGGKAIKVTEFKRERYAVEKYFIEGEAYPLPFIVIKPNESKQKILSYYSEAGKEAIHELPLDAALDEGYTIILPDMLGTGELGRGDYGGTSTVMNPGGIPLHFWYLNNQIERSLLGMWIADMRRIHEFSQEKFPGYESHLWASGYFSIPALHLTAFLDDETRFGLDGLLQSWESLITSKFYDPKWLPTSKPGITFHYDLKDLLSGVDPGQLAIYSLVDAESQRIKDAQAKAPLPNSELYQFLPYLKNTRDTTEKAHGEFQNLLHFLKSGNSL